MSLILAWSICWLLSLAIFALQADKLPVSALILATLFAPLALVIWGVMSLGRRFDHIIWSKKKGGE